MKVLMDWRASHPQCGTRPRQNPHSGIGMGARRTRSTWGESPLGNVCASSVGRRVDPGIIAFEPPSDRSAYASRIFGVVPGPGSTVSQADIPRGDDVVVVAARVVGGRRHSRCFGVGEGLVREAVLVPAQEIELGFSVIKRHVWRLVLPVAVTVRVIEVWRWQWPSRPRVACFSYPAGNMGREARLKGSE